MALYSHLFPCNSFVIVILSTAAVSFPSLDAGRRRSKRHEPVCTQYRPEHVSGAPQRKSRGGNAYDRQNWTEEAMLGAGPGYCSGNVKIGPFYQSTLWSLCSHSVLARARSFNIRTTLSQRPPARLSFPSHYFLLPFHLLHRISSVPSTSTRGRSQHGRRCTKRTTAVLTTTRRIRMIRPATRIRRQAALRESGKRRPRGKGKGRGRQRKRAK